MLPAAVLLAIAGSALWGPAVTLILVKAVAAVFVVVGILWYRADDSTVHKSSISQPVPELPPPPNADPPDGPITDTDVLEELVRRKIAEEALEASRLEEETAPPRSDPPVLTPPPPPGKPEQYETESSSAPGTGTAPAEEPADEAIPSEYTGRPQRAWDTPLRSTLPEDAKLYDEDGSWAIYYSRSAGSFFVQSTDYHPKPFRLTKDKMTVMLDTIRRKSPDGSGKD